MVKIRAVFEKKGRAKYISHLDLNRCMLRTFRRSGLPIWYTEGFNPHPYFSFALALSLGHESECEILDFNLNELVPFDEVRDRLNAVMPEGMRITRVFEPKRKVTAITEAHYEVTLETENSAKLYGDITSLLEQEEILIEKKTKKGVKTVDIKPSVKMISYRVSEKKVAMNMSLPAGTQTNYNPTLFLDALKNAESEPFTAVRICRTGIFCENNEIFS